MKVCEGFQTDFDIPFDGHEYSGSSSNPLLPNLIQRASIGDMVSITSCMSCLCFVRDYFGNAELINLLFSFLPKMSVKRDLVLDPHQIQLAFQCMWNLLMNVGVTGELMLTTLIGCQYYISRLNGLPKTSRSAAVLLAKTLLYNEDENLRNQAFLRFVELLRQSSEASREEYVMLMLDDVDKFLRCCSDEARFRSTEDHLVTLTDQFNDASSKTLFHCARRTTLQIRSATNSVELEDGLEDITSKHFQVVRMWLSLSRRLDKAKNGSIVATGVMELALGILSLCSPASSERFQVVFLLQEIAGIFAFFLPLAHGCLDCLENVHLLQLKDSDMTAISVAKDSLNLCWPGKDVSVPSTAHCVVKAVLETVSQDCALYCHNPGYPEYAEVLIRKLRIFSKKTKVATWRTAARQCLSELEAASSAVAQKRKANEANARPQQGSEICRLSVKRKEGSVHQPKSLEKKKRKKLVD